MNSTLLNTPVRYVRSAMEDIGMITALDEHLNHQIVDTFASVSTSEQSWTEKIWTAIVRKDGAMGVDFGLGRYHNRGVLDGWAAISRGSEQWTVRANRELRDDPLVTEAGPLSYEIIEPLRQVRFACAANDQQPIAYDITFTSEMPPFFEDRHKQREKDGFRIGSDVIRYHQIGTPSGWIEVEGERIEINPEEWTQYRDHSWGTRLDVGAHNADVRPTSDFGDVKFGQGEFVLIWSPFMLVSPSGEKVAYHMYFQSKQGRIFYSSGYRNNPDGTQEKIARVRPELRFDDRTRRLLGGRLHFDMLQGGSHTIEVEVVGTSGVHLGPGLYLGFDGRKHGSWHGPLTVEGEKFDDTLDRKTLERIRQLRDCPIKVTEGDWTGYGIMETIIHGAHPELGLTAENSLV
ncbi:hypothetical protein QUC32_00660 [Novosphingobium resinovorum]|uniref:hypothetical protein n=1 Tax=Novosphingobium TaxID=165696 RepID=UPI001B3C8AD4|nr:MULTISPECIES: hypothetical protein [Novosphingobium]MBF7013351.1 hypothetical protein [Novosphingobium sp. HR1a]WJM25502.1 hypothetical protein QUC32_00660 [Novosphingobium resinovorum]